MRSWILLSSVVALTAAPVWAQTEWRTVRLEKVEISARLVNDVAQIQSLVGDELDREFIFVELKLRPFYDTRLQLSRDHFLLRSRADNESSQAQSPSRIAGSSVLALGEGRAGKGGVFGESGGPMLGGGLPGSGGLPGRMGGRPTAIGSSGGGTAETTVKAKQDGGDGSLEERLTRIELPLEETSDDVAGYLFFQVNPKNKLKRLVFYYDGPYGELEMQFDK